MSELLEKEKKAIETLRFFAGDDPYYVCYSGGKDSDVIRILSELSGCPYELHNNHTTVDTPVTVQYTRDIMKKFGDKKRIIMPDGTTTFQYGGKGFIHLPELSMWDLIVKKGMPPTRIARYCCSELKEKGGRGRRKVTGVRWAESNSRKRNSGLVNVFEKPKDTQRIAENANADFLINDHGGIVLNLDNDPSKQVFETCYRNRNTLLNPIIDWTDDDVWNFLKHYGCDANPEYHCGHSRVGCVGCPMAGGKQQKREFKQYPVYRANYVRAFDRMLAKRISEGKQNFNFEKGWSWADGESVMRWWVGDDPLQITIEDYFNMIDEDMYEIPVME